jgi:hypothetical protein
VTQESIVKQWVSLLESIIEQQWDLRVPVVQQWYIGTWSNNFPELLVFKFVITEHENDSDSYGSTEVVKLLAGDIFKWKTRRK